MYDGFWGYKGTVSSHEPAQQLIFSSLIWHKGRPVYQYHVKVKIKRKERHASPRSVRSWTKISLAKPSFSSSLLPPPTWIFCTMSAPNKAYPAPLTNSFPLLLYARFPTRSSKSMAKKMSVPARKHNNVVSPKTKPWLDSRPDVTKGNPSCLVRAGAGYFWLEFCKWTPSSLRLFFCYF